MSTAQTTTNKATFSRFHDAINTGDAEIISKTIDEVVEPNVLFHAPVPTEATMMIELRGASNAKAKREFGWELRYPSWRLGFREGIG